MLNPHGSGASAGHTFQSPLHPILQLGAGSRFALVAVQKGAVVLLKGGSVEGLKRMPVVVWAKYNWWKQSGSGLRN